MAKASISIKPKIDESWLYLLKGEFLSDYFLHLKTFLESEKKQFTIYPKGSLIFNAFNTTPVDDVKVVLLGQDPYHGVGQAEGLSFSVPIGQRVPPSLKNIYKELQTDLGISPPQHGHLRSWAKQGVLLLNSVLTVRHKTPGSHAGKGWETFTDAVIKKLAENKSNLVFLLWGKYAAEKAKHIPFSNHCVLKAPHPSPYSANYGFFGCKHFSKTNQYLKEKGIEPIDWQPDS